MRKTKKLLLLLIIMAMICIAGLLCFVKAEQSGVFDRITGLTAVQKGTSILIDWDAMDCESYDLHIAYGEDNSFMITTQTNHVKIPDVQAKTKYIIGVSAQIGYNRFTDKEEITIQTK